MPVPPDFIPFLTGKHLIPGEPTDYQKRFTAMRLAVSHTENMEELDLRRRAILFFEAFGLEVPPGWER